MTHKETHLGGGVILYENVFELDWAWMRSFCHKTTAAERAAMYELRVATFLKRIQLMSCHGGVRPPIKIHDLK